MAKQKSAKREIESLDLLPRAEGLKRADDLLRAMLSSPPDPFTQFAAQCICYSSSSLPGSRS